MRTHQKELAALLRSVHSAAQETEGEGQLLSFFSDRVPVIKYITSTVHCQRAPGGNHKISGIFRPPKGYRWHTLSDFEVTNENKCSGSVSVRFWAARIRIGSVLMVTLYDEKTSFLQYIPVWHIRDKHPGSRIRIFRFRIPDLGSKRSRITDPVPHPRIYVFLTQKTVSKLSEKLSGYSFLIPDPQTLVHSLT
jgi:hypothetical protein